MFWAHGPPGWVGWLLGQILVGYKKKGVSQAAQIASELDKVNLSLTFNNEVYIFEIKNSAFKNYVSVHKVEEELNCFLLSFLGFFNLEKSASKTRL